MTREEMNDALQTLLNEGMIEQFVRDSGERAWRATAKGKAPKIVDVTWMETRERYARLRLKPGISLKDIKESFDAGNVGVDQVYDEDDRVIATVDMEPYNDGLDTEDGEYDGLAFEVIE